MLWATCVNSLGLFTGRSGKQTSGTRINCTLHSLCGSGVLVVLQGLEELRGGGLRVISGPFGRWRFASIHRIRMLVYRHQYHSPRLTRRCRYRDYAIENDVDLLEPGNLPGQRFCGLTLRSAVGLFLREPGPVRRCQRDRVVIGRTVIVRNDSIAHSLLQMRIM
jgi:hypothetical protein